MADEDMTLEEFITDLRMRIRCAPDKIGDDFRALPPVDWDHIRAERQAVKDCLEQCKLREQQRFSALGKLKDTVTSMLKKGE